MLRQPKSVSKTEKHEYVEQVIKMLGMEDFAEAVVGVPGEGLNVEQRKLLTIGVELAAKPKLLLFLDEPTSGLDSQSSWAICAFLRKLADNGQVSQQSVPVRPVALLTCDLLARRLFSARSISPALSYSSSSTDFFSFEGEVRRCTSGRLATTRTRYLSTSSAMVPGSAAMTSKRLRTRYTCHQC